MARHRSVVSAVLAVLLATPVHAAPVLTSQPLKWRFSALGANRLPDAVPDSGRVAGAVAVYDRGAIERSGARSLPELLSRQAGVNAFDQNGNSFQPTLDMRGFNAQPVPALAVVVDGVRVNNPDFGAVNWHLIPLAEVERVEVHAGPATLYGRGALSGVVHVTTRRPGKGAPLSAETGAAFGAFARRKGWASAAGTAGAFDWRVHAEREKERGWRDHSQADVSNARLKLGLRPDADLDLSVEYHRADDRLNQAGSITGPELAADRSQHVSQVDTVNKLDSVVGGVRKALPWDLSLSGGAWWRSRREATPENKGRTTFAKAASDMAARGGALQLGRTGEAWGRAWALTAGGEAGRTETDGFTDSSLGKSGSLVKDDAAAGFAQASVDLVPERLTATAGFRYDENRVHYEDKFKPSENGRVAYRRSSPRLGLSWNPSERVTVFAAYAEAFRAPTANELKPFGVAFNGQPLNAVQVRQFEMGFRSAPADGAALSASFFRSDALDEIYFDSSKGSFGANVNLPRVRRYGTEASAGWEGERWEARAGHAFTRAEFLSEVTLSKAPWPATQRAERGDTLPMVPEHRGTLEVAFKPAPGWRLSADGLCAGSQRVFNDESNAEPTLPSYCVANLGGRLERGAWVFSLRGTNVTDARYQARAIVSELSSRAQRFYVPAPGVGFEAGVAWRWGGSGAKAARRRAPGGYEVVRRAL